MICIFLPENHFLIAAIILEVAKTKLTPNKKVVLEFQKLIVDPILGNQNRYKQFRDKLTKWIRKSKKEHNFRKLGKYSTAKTIYKSLKQSKKATAMH